MSRLDSETIIDILKQEQKNIRYDTRDWSIEMILSKYHKMTETQQTEINIPFYQREFVWKPAQTSSLVESILLGLPLPLIFFEQTEDGLLEIIDGSQRIRALDKFFSNQCELKNLKILNQFNRLKFSDFPPSIQRKLKESSLRVVVLESNENENAKDIAHEIFERINTAGTKATAMEARRGANYGKFIEFIYQDCSNDEKFNKIAKLGEKSKLRGYQQELIVKFFSYYEEYKKYSKIEFQKNISTFLSNYIKEKNKDFDIDDTNKSTFGLLFRNVIDFIDQCKMTESEYYKKRKKDKLLAIMIAVAIHLDNNHNHTENNKKIDIWLPDFINNSDSSSLEKLNQNITILLKIFNNNQKSLS